MKEYKLTEYDIHEFMGKQKINSFNGCVGINIIQKQGTSLYRAINKVVFSLKENDIHYRKRGQTVSFEDKKVNTGIIFKKDKHIVKINKMSIKVKSIRTSDTYAREALTHKVKYCRIVRKPFNNSYKYFLQIVLEGTPPVKHSLGSGLCGIDEGTSTVAYYNDTEADFIVIADKVDKYNKEIIKWMRILERRRRLNNPDNYNPDGTIKKGKRFSVVVVAEGAMPKGGTITVEGTRNNGAGVDNTKLGGVGQQVAKELERLTGLEARNTTLGYMQRGGTPTAYDRVLCTKYGTKAMELALEGKFGTLVVIKNGKLDYASLEDVVVANTQIGAVSGNTQESNLRKITMDDDLIKTARNIGINLGD